MIELEEFRLTVVAISCLILALQATNTRLFVKVLISKQILIVGLFQLCIVSALGRQYINILDGFNGKIPGLYSYPD